MVTLTSKQRGDSKASSAIDQKGLRLKAHSRKYVCLTSNSATSLGEAQIGQHTAPCNIMLHFVTVCTICYLLLSCGPGHCCESVSQL